MRDWWPPWRLAGVLGHWTGRPVSLVRWRTPVFGVPDARKVSRDPDEVGDLCGWLEKSPAYPAPRHSALADECSTHGTPPGCCPAPRQRLSPGPYPACGGDDGESLALPPDTFPPPEPSRPRFGSPWRKKRLRR